MKTEVLCFANNKGGSGKSTTCSSVAYAMAEKGNKVLLIDGDMQLNLTLSYFTEDKALEIAAGDNNLYYAVKNQKPLDDFICKTDYPNIDIIPSSTLMSSVEFELFTKWQREFILKKMLKNIVDSGVYNYILIDAPPTLGCWVMNILIASDKIILPVEASPWGLFGLANMMEFISQVKELSPSLDLLGVAITKVDARKNYFKQTMETLNAEEGIKVFENVIHLDSSVEWAQDNSKPVGSYKKSSRSALEYSALTDEILNELRPVNKSQAKKRRNLK
ncbi:MAG: ParA family protein [Clostridia bacterium]|nr:ParA family protein [Clostridia bacterium]